VSASNSIFLGPYAGYYTSYASHSIFLGYRAGANYDFIAEDSTYLSGSGPNNIIIGTNITLENDRKDSINLGAVIFATGSYSDTTTNPYSGSANGKVGINQPNPSYELDVSGSINFTGNLYQNGSPYGGGSAEKYIFVTQEFRQGTGSIFGNNESPTSTNRIYNPNYSNVDSLVSSYLSYVYVDIVNSNRSTQYEGLSFSTVTELKEYINNAGIDSGSITLYAYKNDTSNLVLGGYNSFVTSVAYRSSDGKVSSKRGLTKMVDTTKAAYTALTGYLTGSFVTALSSSISLPTLNEIITEAQINYIVTNGVVRFANMDKYNRRELSGFYLSLTTAGGNNYVVNSTGDGFIGSIGSRSKLLSTSLLRYNYSGGPVISVSHVSLPYWQGPNDTFRVSELNGGSYSNLYIMQEVDSNGRAIYIEPLSIDGIVVPFSSKKYVLDESDCKYFMKKGNRLIQIDNTLNARIDSRYNVESISLTGVGGSKAFLSSLKQKKSKKQIDIVRLYSDKTCDVFENGLRIEHSSYVGNIGNQGIMAYYFKLNKR